MDGIIVINKPKGYTSRDIVNIVGKELHTKQIGHTGTLDPMATGVLILCVGKATKIAELLTSEDKEYEVEMELGFETDTLDLEGKIIYKKEIPSLEEKDIIETFKSFVGPNQQEVPMYSAVKVNGKKLYEYARKNQEVALPIKDIVIHSLDFISYSGNKIQFRTKVSKGTYIRSLVRDIAAKWNTVATMTSLNRTKQGNYAIENAYTLDDIKGGKYTFINIIDALKLPKIEVDQEMAFKIKNGQILERFFKEDISMIIYNNELLAIYKTYEKDSTKVKPYKMF